MQSSEKLLTKAFPIPEVAPVITKITVDEKNGKYGVPETVDPFDYYQWLKDYYGIDMSQINSEQ